MKRLTYDQNTLVMGMTPADWRRHWVMLKKANGFGNVSNGRSQVHFPAVLPQLEWLQRHFPDLEIDDSVYTWRIHERRAQAFALLSKSKGPDGKIEATGCSRFWMDERVRLEPIAHQIPLVAWLIHTMGGVCTDDMGLGKTYEAIMAACYVMQEIQDAKRVVVVCPNTIKTMVWEAEIEKLGWGDKPLHPYRWAQVPVGTLKERRQDVANWAEDGWRRSKWLILNYESLDGLAELERDEANHVRGVGGAFAEATKDSILILDEVHRVKNGRGARALAIRHCNRVRTWGLTGTAVANRIEDLWHLLRVTRPGVMYWNFPAFSAAHCVRGRFQKVVQYKNMEAIQKRVGMVCVGRKKEDCVDLPPKIFSTRLVTLAREERKAYEQMREELRAWYDAQDVDESGDLTEAKAANFAARLLRLRQINDGLVSEGAGAEKIQSWSKSLTKLREVVNVWEDADHCRMVAWVAYVPVGQRLTGLFVDHVAGLQEEKGVWFLGGHIPDPRQRQECVEAWTEKGGVIVANMDAMGEGWNGQAGDLQCFVDVPWTPKQRLQCIDRLHRMGQENPVRIVDIMAAETVDPLLRETLYDKIENAETAMKHAYKATRSSKLRKWLD